MTLRVPTPRLLPATVTAMAVLLSVKTVGLVRATAASLESAGGNVVVATAKAAVPDGTSPAMPIPTPAAKAEAPPISDGERAILQELRQRRQELDGRELSLNARESVLAAAEQKFTARVTELTALQKKLEALEAAHRQREDAGWQGLVKLYESMRPRDAATIFNDLQMPVLLSVLDRMKEAKAAPIMAAMNPDKAREATSQLAELRTRRENPGASPNGG